MPQNKYSSRPVRTARLWWPIKESKTNYQIKDQSNLLKDIDLLKQSQPRSNAYMLKHGQLLQAAYDTQRLV
jgi:hypothetical protein